MFEIKHRLRMALSILRGYPVAYRLTIEPGFGLTINANRATIVGCTFLGNGTETTSALNINYDDANSHEWPWM